MLVKRSDAKLISSVQTPLGRVYKTPDGCFPSVSTIVSKMASPEKLAGLEKWRKRIGYKEAAKITKESAIRGSIVHKAVENWLLEKTVHKTIKTDEHLILFARAFNIIEPNIGEIYGVETPIFHPIYKYAGRLDLAADWNGSPAIIDLKTKSKVQKKQWLLEHFYQLSAYAVALNRYCRLNDIETRFRTCVIVPVAVSKNQKPVVIEEDEFSYYWKKFKKMANKYHEEYGHNDFSKLALEGAEESE